MNETTITRTSAPASRRRAGKLASAAILLVSAASLTYATPPDPCIRPLPANPVITLSFGDLLRVAMAVWTALGGTPILPPQGCPHGHCQP